MSYRRAARSTRPVKKRLEIARGEGTLESGVTVAQKPVAPFHIEFAWELSCLLDLILNVTPEMTSLTNLKPADEQIHIFALFPVFTRD